ncbi:RNA polymerase subunit RPO35 [Equine parapoxvirus]|nr:RNA polymerase subunit RPO35 [Equine parapoxvirus]WOC35515.1 RNA polymerase subunit RPO35 [Equine parapoxvirus]
MDAAAVTTREAVLAAALPPPVASLIKHEFARHVRWPALSLGVVLENTTTCVHEEWLTAVESMPTRHVFRDHVADVLERRVGLAVHLRFAQSAPGQVVTLHDFDFYLTRDGAVEPVPKPDELRLTLLHTFHDFRPKSEQVIELVAFSAGTEVSEALVDALSFLDAEAFRREYENAKVSHCREFRGYAPFVVVAPAGRLTVVATTYSWLDNRRHLHEFLRFLEGRVLEDIAAHEVREGPPDHSAPASVFNAASGLLYVNDLLTACAARFFGCEARLDSFHRFDLRAADTAALARAIRDAFAELRRAELRERRADE